MEMDPSTAEPNNKQPSTAGIRLGAGGGIFKGERVTVYSLSPSSLLDNPKGYGGRRGPNNQPDKWIMCRQMANEEEWAFVVGNGSVI